MESRTKNEKENIHEGDLSAGESEDSPNYEVELMTGDEADDEEEESYGDIEEETAGDASPEGQHLFPSFSALFPPLGHSRPSSFFTEPPPPPPPPRTFQTESFHRSYYSSPDDSERVLGSGNFGVIRGGTYYSGSNDEIPFIRGPNSHSRPYRRPNPLPQYRHGGDFFAGFKDFADITTPAKPSYSQIYVVYANRNSTKENDNIVGRPKNIRELLEADSEEITKSKSKKKLNQYKEKTAALEASKKYRGLSKDFGEPLLALS
ncbi:hypothetical protein O3M35_006573 [Rhynocoris fuscipes]|uniref:Uncharacterized protein n=1 Tax=Rhynocoris fuscipes TaxID=488301 RepID=A0AAW1DGP6_9HEMI